MFEMQVQLQNIPFPVFCRPFHPKKGAWPDPRESTVFARQSLKKVNYKLVIACCVHRVEKLDLWVWKYWQRENNIDRFYKIVFLVTNRGDSIKGWPILKKKSTVRLLCKSNLSHTSSTHCSYLKILIVLRLFERERFLNLLFAPPRCWVCVT